MLKTARPALTPHVPTSVRGIERREAVLRAATDEFLTRGYEGAVIADISARAGGSTATIYKHFGDKAGLFAEVVAQEHLALSSALDRRELSHEPMESGLPLFAEFYIEGMLSKNGAALMRVVIAESSRFPDLATTVQDGNRAMIGKLCAYLEVRAALDDYDIPVPWEAAESFVSTLRGRILSNGFPPLKLADSPELTAFVARTVAHFRLVYGRR